MNLNTLRWTILACLLAIPFAGAAFAEHHEEMVPGALTEADRAELITLLEDSRTRVETLAAHASGDMWSKKPAEDRWSVGEVVEHLALAEEGLFAMSMGALEQPADPEWETIRSAATAEGLVGMLKDRTEKFTAPPEFVPQGTMSRDETLKRFGAARAITLDFVRRTHAPLQMHTSEGPAGKMNVHQWMVLVAGHSLRHSLQIEEVLEQLKMTE